MSTDRPGEPWPEASYRGYAGRSRPAEADPPGRRPRLALSRQRLLLGGAAAVVLGLALGFWARPDLANRSPAAPADAESTAPGVPIEVARPPPQPQPRAAGKLEVLPPAVAEAARAQAASAAAARATSAATEPTEPDAAPGIGDAAPRLAVRPPRAAGFAPPIGRAGFDCATARAGAEQIVCSDPMLAAEDRELARAYRRALASGAAPPGALRADQRNWMAIREDAARHSRRALADVYRQRIDELNSIAEDDEGAPPDDDGPGG